jgi:hypothetical protein
MMRVGQIALNGIDRWIGGADLQGHRVPWRWDDDAETIVHLLPGKTGGLDRGAGRAAG